MYDRFPYIAAGAAAECITGWESIAACLATQQARCIAIECYPGAFEHEIQRAVDTHLHGWSVFLAKNAMSSPERIAEQFSAQLTDDPVFGQMSNATLGAFFDPDSVRLMRAEVANCERAIVIGVGATLLTPEDALLVYADMARWELQLRQRRNEIPNLGMSNYEERASLKYKRAFFLDWRVADRAKTQLLGKIDFLLDTHIPGEPKLISGDAFRRGLQLAAKRPFRVVPFFDPGPWGGHWMERVCGLPDDGAPNHAWCFDCVPEENSLLLGFGDHRVEIPSLDVVLQHPRELLGENVYQRFGAEFPIRFDFLDTMGGGNLSLQVHPLTEYIRATFGMDYTQDESYYMLDAAEGAEVFLGLKTGVDKEKMLGDLAEAQTGTRPFPVEEYVNQFSARKHDHFLIPAGTVHCSGKNSMVLEISATPYIFTFKLWDWGRLGLDGRPRPVHLEHGARNICWDRTTEWTAKNLVNQFIELGKGDGWREERTGLHELEFIETRRHWFSVPVAHDTRGTVCVLNLVEGEEAMVESPTQAFAPFLVHYAETFIVPAAIGAFTIRPHGPSLGKQCVTMLAYVR